MNEKKQSILVVEDDMMLLDILAEKLKSEGFTVYLAKDGEEGLVQTLKYHPDLILLDIVMPKMDGVTMLKKIREDEESLGIPVILLTNLSYGSQVDEAMKHGVQDFLVKTNWKLDDVVERIRLKLGLEEKN